MDLTDNWNNDAKAALQRRQNISSEKAELLLSLYEIAKELHDYKVIDDRIMLMLNHFMKDKKG